MGLAMEVRGKWRSLRSQVAPFNPHTLLSGQIELRTGERRDEEDAKNRGGGAGSADVGGGVRAVAERPGKCLVRADAARQGGGFVGCASGGPVGAPHGAAAGATAD